LNEIALNANVSFLTFSSDSGAIGVIDLSSEDKVAYMRVSHQSICGTVSFIPDRPSELVSGGYDHALLHFDFKQRSLLSRYDIAPPMVTSGVSLSPPFIQCMVVLPSGVIVAGTADGHLWIGLGGEKAPPNSRHSRPKAKKSRKWEGLDAKRGSYQKMAEGPIVSISVTGTRSFIWSTLLGKVYAHDIVDAEGQAASESCEIELKLCWEIQAEHCAKVNGLAWYALNKWVAIAGLDADGQKGAIEVWKVE